MASSERWQEALAFQQSKVDSLEGELAGLRMLSSSVQEDLVEAQGQQSSCQQTLEEEWAERSKQQMDAAHARELSLKASHEEARVQLEAMHAAELQEYKRAEVIIVQQCTDLTAEKADMEARIKDKDEQLSELHSAIEELEEENRHEVLLLHKQHHVSPLNPLNPR